MTNVFIHNQPLAEKGPPFAGGALVLAVIPDQQIGRQEAQASWIFFHDKFKRRKCRLCLHPAFFQTHSSCVSQCIAALLTLLGRSVVYIRFAKRPRPAVYKAFADRPAVRTADRPVLRGEKTHYSFLCNFYWKMSLRLPLLVQPVIYFRKKVPAKGSELHYALALQ